jgi:hypothetical protein
MVRVTVGCFHETQGALLAAAFSFFFCFFSFTLSLGLLLVLGFSCPFGMTVFSLASNRWWTHHCSASDGRIIARLTLQT